MAQKITVKSPFGNQHTDEQIAHSIVSSFEWHTEIPHDKLKVKVQQGWVTIDGEVDWHYQRGAAEQAVESLLGVRGVTNLIRVSARVAAQDVTHKIVNAFKRNAVLGAQQIKVETSGGRVILSGKVHSWAERLEAENAAWAAPGVMAVDDELMVVP